MSGFPGTTPPTTKPKKGRGPDKKPRKKGSGRKPTFPERPKPTTIGDAIQIDKIAKWIGVDAAELLWLQQPRTYSRAVDFKIASDVMRFIVDRMIDMCGHEQNDAEFERGRELLGRLIRSWFNHGYSFPQDNQIQKVIVNADLRRIPKPARVYPNVPPLD